MITSESSVKHKNYINFYLYHDKRKKHILVNFIQIESLIIINFN